MMQSLHTAATGMVAQQANLDVISNNLANVNTTGYKEASAQFQDLIYQTHTLAGVASSGSSASPVTTQVGLGAKFSATSTNFTEGSLLSTGNPLDLAISGNGFFKVQLPDGTDGYTRDGNFKVDSANILVTTDGYPLQPPITMPQGASSITVDNQGNITATNASGEVVPVTPPIQLTTFPNPGALQRSGQNLFLATTAAGAAQDGQVGQNGAGTVVSGYQEGSNVQVVTEMVNMISAQRAYEINSKAIQTSDEMLQTVNGLKR
jgi:flagellar basal-body rod protein FlgG